MKQYKIIVVGIGHQALKEHIPEIIKSDRFQLVGIVDRQPDVRNNVAHRYKTRGFATVEDAMQSTKVDTAVVCVSHDQYLPILRVLLKKNIAVLKEKPLARNLKEARGLITLTKKYKPTLMVNVQRRFMNHYNEVTNAIRKIGSVFFIDGRYTISVPNPHEGWRGQVNKAGGGCILDMGYHIIDLLLWYQGLPQKVFADFGAYAKPLESYDAEDTAFINFRYTDSNKFGNLIISRCIPPQKEYMQFIGTQGLVRVDNKTCIRFDSLGNKIEEKAFSDGKSNGSMSAITYFCHMLDGNKMNITSVHDQLIHMAFIEACYDSKKIGSYINPHQYLRGEI